MLTNYRLKFKVKIQEKKSQKEKIFNGLMIFLLYKT